MGQWSPGVSNIQRCLDGVEYYLYYLSSYLNEKNSNSLAWNWQRQRIIRKWNKRPLKLKGCEVAVVVWFLGKTNEKAIGTSWKNYWKLFQDFNLIVQTMRINLVVSLVTEDIELLLSYMYFCKQVLNTLWYFLFVGVSGFRRLTCFVITSFLQNVWIEMLPIKCKQIRILFK